MCRLLNNGAMSGIAVHVHIWQTRKSDCAVFSAVDISSGFCSTYGAPAELQVNFCAIKHQVTSSLSSVLPMYLVVELSAPPTPIAWCRMSDNRAFPIAALCVWNTLPLAKLHLLIHCIHSGDISKHSCFSDLYRTSSWHSSGLPIAIVLFY